MAVLPKIKRPRLLIKTGPGAGPGEGWKQRSSDSCSCSGPRWLVFRWLSDSVVVCGLYAACLARNVHLYLHLSSTVSLPTLCILSLHEHILLHPSQFPVHRILLPCCCCSTIRLEVRDHKSHFHIQYSLRSNISTHTLYLKHPLFTLPTSALTAG